MATQLDLEAERSVLGALMLDPQATARVRDILPTPAFFGDPFHQAVYEACLGLGDRGEPIDGLLVADEIGEPRLSALGGLGAVLDLDQAGTAVNVEVHARRVRDAASGRELGRLLREAHEARRAGTPWVAVADHLCTDVLALRGRERPEGVAFDLGADDAIAHVHQLSRAGTGLAGRSTGFGCLDRVLGGLEPGHLIVCAGRPAMGKTTLGLCIAANIARAGATVAAFSLEMPSRELILRVLAAEGRVDGMALRTGRVSAEQVDHLLAARRRLRGLPLHVDDTAGVGVEHIEAVCARLSARRDAPPLGLVWIDYVQLMSGRGHTREEVVAGNSRGLKALAKRLGVPVLLIAQVNRESEHRANKRPALAELRESGAIEQDADAVLLLYRDEYYDENSRAVGIAEVHVAKNRHGPVGMVELRFFHAWSLFAERDPAG